jgi:hypothetical protein
MEGSGEGDRTLDRRSVVTKPTKRAIEATLAVMATLALSIVAVWLTGDPRAAGLVVIAAGVAVSGVIGVHERRATHGHEAGRPTAAKTAEGTTKFTKAA